MAAAGLADELERHFWASIEESVATEVGETQIKFVAYIEFFSYDGVELTLGTRQKLGFGANFEVHADSDEGPVAMAEEVAKFWGS